MIKYLTKIPPKKRMASPCLGSQQELCRGQLLLLRDQLYDNTLYIGCGYIVILCTLVVVWCGE